MNNLQTAKAALKKAAEKRMRVRRPKLIVTKGGKPKTPPKLIKRGIMEDEIVRTSLTSSKIVFHQKIGQMYSTKDYKLFRFVTDHRPIIDTPKQFKRLLATLEKDGLIVPGAVDKYGNIADGQRRLLACKMLNLPFKFILIEQTTPEIIRMFALRV